MSNTFRSNGKLLLSGEYFVLDGALSLAVPTRQGQNMIVTVLNEPQQLIWRSYGIDGPDQIWFEAHFDINQLLPVEATDPKAAQFLTAIFQSIQKQRPGFWNQYVDRGLIVETFLEFPRKWGLGTSSTMLNNLAEWSQTNPHTLLKNSFGGSGYDLACARAEGPVLFQKRATEAHFVHVPFHPPFSNQLYFVYLGQKQNSREGILRYRQKMETPDQSLLQRISEITTAFLSCNTLKDWQKYTQEHENLISATLELPKVKDLHFNDFPGSVKSLGAWGGDFVLASSTLNKSEVKKYFEAKGLTTMITFEEMILRKNSSAYTNI